MIYPKNKKFFKELIPFSKNIIKILQKNKITPVIYGSFSHFYHTKDKNIRVNDIENSQVSTEELANGDRWEEMVSFVPQSSGAGQKVEFWLYRTGEAEPCLEKPLYLYLDVTEPSL